MLGRGSTEWGLILLTTTETSRKAVAAAMRNLELDSLARSLNWLRTCGSMEEGGTVTGIIG